MSIHESNVLNTSNSLLMNQNRAEFLEKFQGQNNNYKQTDNNQKGRWNQLYNHSKLRKMKEEVYRKKAIEERENELLTECTFQPKLTNNPKYYKNNYLLTYQNTQPKETNGQAYTPSITERQETWLQKKAMKMEQIKQYENNLELMECHFKPTINSGNKSLSRIGYGQTAEDILEDPESYNIYINRQKNKRQEEEKKTQREKSLPGSGYLWKNKPRNYNPNYDYTKHEISKRDIPFSKSIKSLNKPSAQNKFSVRKSKSAKKVQLNQDKYFDFLYSGKKNTDNQVNENNNINNIQIPANVQLIRFEKEIEFGKALEVLHNELYSFKLMDDE